jgi:hypothetical protein
MFSDCKHQYQGLTIMYEVLMSARFLLFYAKKASILDCAKNNTGLHPSPKKT